MWFHIDPSSGVPIYIQIMDQVKHAIASGLLEGGDQLPSVRELALQLTINPNTVAKAYTELERYGSIVTLRGRGTFVSGKGLHLPKDERVKVATPSIDKLLVDAYHLKLDRDEVIDLIRRRMDHWSRRLEQENMGQEARGQGAGEQEQKQEQESEARETRETREEEERRDE